MNDNKKPFDSTVCFTFYGSWARTIEQLETEAEENSLAYKLFKAISDYSLYGVEPNFDDLEPLQQITLKAVWETISTEIDNSVARRKRGFANEKPTELQEAIIAECIKSPLDSCRAIGDAVGASKSEVDRVRKKYAKRIRTGIESLQTAYTKTLGTTQQEDQEDIPIRPEVENLSKGLTLETVEDDLPF